MEGVGSSAGASGAAAVLPGSGSQTTTTARMGDHGGLRDGMACDGGDNNAGVGGGTDEATARPTKNQIGKALYPIPEPLSRILTSVLSDDDNDDKQVVVETTTSSPVPPPAVVVKAQRESIEDALGILCGNAFQALDSMFFQAAARLRTRPSFRHRLCLRIHLDKSSSTLTMTDLGCGMTRSDLINVLGVGGHMSPRAIEASRRLPSARKSAAGGIGDGGGGGDADESNNNMDTTESMSQQREVCDDDFDDLMEQDSGGGGGDGGTTSGEDDEGQEEDRALLPPPPSKEEANSSSSSISRPSSVMVVVPCTSQDVGGFYSALCALGTKVNVGTKSKFDDYYEFEVGGEIEGQTTTASDAAARTITHFTITRPLEEGTKPSADNGYNGFTDVRGESGTRVTVTLNRSAVEDAGLLDPAKVKAALTKIFEASHYTFAFSTDEDAPAIIAASKKEEIDQEQKRRDHAAAGFESDGELEDYDVRMQDDSSNGRGIAGSHNTVKERSKYIPLRLSLQERKMLRLVESAMVCSDYTTNVDQPFKNAAKRTHVQLKNVSAILKGLVIACDYAAGQTLVEEGNYSDYEKFFRQMFEIARRHKIMNPEKMRTEYGKLTYLLQDAVSPTVQSHLGFSCKGSISTVYRFLEERNCVALLEDPLIETATMEILAGKKSRGKIQSEIRKKEKAVNALKAKYRSHNLNPDDIHLCLYSICDNNSFLNSNRVPIDKVIGYLEELFSPDKIKDGYSLSIVSGIDGARLSHRHERQYYFALQSLTLWRDIVDDMFRLWHHAEEDLLSESVTYALRDTGQGMQRVQQSPRTYKDMQQILVRVQGKVNKWIGSSVIHMGDHNVPNALSFIDKYTQVPRILGPIVTCLENIERICEEDDGVSDYVQCTFGGLKKLRKDILYDFFKSAFDGSGADNFYDAGSCIDGRLTSAWNWCSQLSTKPYYPIFKLTGFTGFDGEFK